MQEIAVEFSLTEFNVHVYFTAMRQCPVEIAALINLTVCYLSTYCGLEFTCCSSEFMTACLITCKLYRLFIYGLLSVNYLFKSDYDFASAT